MKQRKYEYGVARFLVLVAFMLVSVTAVSKTGLAAQTVTFSKPSGTYDTEFALSLTSGAGETIYYTLDGSDPRDSATRIEYQSEITVKDRKGDANVLTAIDPSLYDSANVRWDSEQKKFVTTLSLPSDSDIDKITTIRATSKDSAGTYSPVQTCSYFVGAMANHIKGIESYAKAAGIPLSIMSISMNQEDLFDSKKGIYVHGDIFDKALEEYLASGKTIDGRNAVDTARHLSANYNQKGKGWERPAHIDYFESDGTTTTCQVSQDCGIRIQGNFSRSDLQKGFRLFAREEYGEKNFKYPFFGTNSKNDQGEVISKFKKLTLRNGGNCAFTSKFNDAFWESLIGNLKVDKQAMRACVVYLNGEYWGLYILEEDFNDTFFEQKHGVNKDDVVVYKGDAEALAQGYKLDEGALPEGVTQEDYYFQPLLKFFANHENLKNPANYKIFAELVDVESIRDYFAMNIWVNNKWDWPGKNWSMWKTTKIDPTIPYADGKWRLCSYDLDFGGVSGSGDARTNTIKEDKLLDPEKAKDTMQTENGEQEVITKPHVMAFIYLMTNPDFRADFNKKLLSLTSNEFEKTKALERLEMFKNSYEPLFDQFFQRYPGTGNTNSAINGGYATYACIKSFLSKRESYIEKMITYSDTYHEGLTLKDEPDDDPSLYGITFRKDETPGTTKPTSKPSSVKLPAKGTKITSLSSGKYVITKSAKTGGTVTFIAPKSASKNKVTIPPTITYNKITYKVTKIQANAFAKNKKLTTVVIGKNITTIGKKAFYNCKNLNKITIKTKSLKASNIGSKAFANINAKAKVSVPKTKKSAYKAILKKRGLTGKKQKVTG